MAAPQREGSEAWSELEPLRIRLARTGQDHGRVLGNPAHDGEE
jgi:hypothetical protein